MNSRFRRGPAFPVVAALLFAGLSVQMPHAVPPDLEIRDLGTFNGYESHGHAINDRGQVVGTAVIVPGQPGSSPGELRSFLWEAGVMTDLGTGDLIAVDINNHGQILMQSPLWRLRGSNACFLRDRDVIIDLGNLGGTTCFAGDLNNSGQAVGSVEVELQGRPTSRAFVWSSGVMTDLGTLGGIYAYAAAINDRGQIVGATTMQQFGNLRAFLWERGEMIDLGSPGGPQSAALAINNRGQVVMMSPPHVYLWENGTTTDLGTFGGDITYPNDINERGQILLAVNPTSTMEFRYGLWEDGTMTWLPTLGSGDPSAWRLNNHGVIVGHDQVDAADPSHVVLWAPGGAPGRGDR